MVESFIGKEIVLFSTNLSQNYHPMYVIKRRANPTEYDILEDIKMIIQKLGRSSITMKEYDIHGNYSVSTEIRKLGTWNNILKCLNAPLNNIFYHDEDLLNNIKAVWLQKGTQPTRRDMDNKEWSEISSGAYLRHFGSWYNALDRFVEYINKEDEDTSISLSSDKSVDSIYKHKTKREPSDRLKVQVLMRDGNRCRICGVKCNGGIHKLHFDHIKPWSKGGETTLDNIQVLCSVCNAALGNSDKE